jgi:hypothetical protein
VLSAHCSAAFSYINDPMGMENEAHWVNHLPGGRLEETLPHLVYILVTLLNDPTLEVTSISHRKETSFPWVRSDTLSAQLTGQKAMGTVFLTLASEVTRMRVDVVGTKRIAEADFATHWLDLVGLPGYQWSTPVVLAKRWLELAGTSMGRLAAATSLGIQKAAGRWPGGDEWLMRLFCESVRRGTPPPVSAEEAIATVRITNRIVEMLRSDWARDGQDRSPS